MIVDLDNIGALVEKLIEEQEQTLVDEQTTIAKSIHRELYAASPFKTGQFRDSWTPYVGSMPTDPDARADESVFDQWKPGMEIGEVNNQPYGPRLAAGLSKQRRNGWITTTINRGLNARKKKS